ncbi:MAG: hypothetical protein ABSD20_20955, partial [Terriglobales bacterium]
MKPSPRTIPNCFLAASVFAVLFACCASLDAQSVPVTSGGTHPQPVPSAQSPRVGAVEDWSSHAVVFSNLSALEKSGRPDAADRARKIASDPRYIMEQLRRRQPVSDSSLAALANLAAKLAAGDSSAGVHAAMKGVSTTDGLVSADLSRLHSRAMPSRPMERDWSVSLGLAGVASDMYPAKFTADASHNTPNCQEDFVVFGVYVDGFIGQANIMGFNNLYVNSQGTGYCPGTSPNVMFSYYVDYGALETSPSISLDGTSLVFVDSTPGASQLHVLKIGTSGNNGTSATAPAFPGDGNNAIDTSVELSGGVQVSRSSVFMDWVNDNAYVGDDAGVLHLFHPVFGGPLAEVTTGGWPITILSESAVGAPPVLSAPSYDSYSQ